MPVYTYQCQQCDTLSEVSHGAQETPYPACPACGGLTRRVIGKPPTLLKRSQPEPSSEPPPQEAHQCHSACVLHRKPTPPAS